MRLQRDVGGGEMYIKEFGKASRILPTYTCGHCTSVVVMRPDRIRPREMCHSCMNPVCDRPICHAQCTPLSALADDKFEGAGEKGRLVNAIMGGATTLEEASKLGLLKKE